LECVVNISEGNDLELIAELAKAAGESLLDTHSDPYHHRSVFTLFGATVYSDVVKLTEKAFELLDITNHSGVHPRMGVVDVVPFVPVGDSDISQALQARQRFAREISTRFSVPVFLYGPDRTLPHIRREAFKTLAPDFGPPEPHPRWGSVSAGAREPLVAYNLYLSDPDLEAAKLVAKQVRCQHFRTLGLRVGDQVQVSANLIDPLNHGVYEFYRAVNSLVKISKGELVGLAPLKVIEETPKELWAMLDLSIDKAFESRATRINSDPSK
jgi:glutamate formiminotransferase/glutamate formiminotransferase/formiminotetrahydrofolate cyclodeaminase